MNRPLLGIATLLITLGVAIAAPASASRIEFTPVIGHVQPMVNQISNADIPLYLRQSAFTGYGARTSWWISPRVGVEAGVLVGSTELEIFANDIVTVNSQMAYFDARMRVRLNDPAASTGIDLIGGLALTDLDDPLSEIGEDLGFKSPTGVAGVVGLGATTGVTDRIRLRFDLVDYFHGSNYEVDDSTYGMPVDGSSQQDLVVTIGMVVDVWQN